MDTFQMKGAIIPPPHGEAVPDPQNPGNRPTSARTGSSRRSRRSRPTPEPSTRPTPSANSPFDVYATPFVPDLLKTINHLVGSYVIDTESARKIDFDSYSSMQIPFGHLPKPFDAPPPSLAGVDDSLETSANLGTPGAISDHEKNRLAVGPTQKDYAHFFQIHLDNEIISQDKENAAYSLYDHEGLVKFIDGTSDAQVTISVPGLRENSPFVEEDDVVQLRQIRYDRAGHQMVPMPGYPIWTEIIYNARVSGVLRAKEILVLRVAGLNFVTSELNQQYYPQELVPSEHHLKFNISFPITIERYQPMMDILPQVQGLLQQASSATYESSHPDDGLSLISTNSNQYWVQSMLFPTEADCDSQDNLKSGHTTRQFFDRDLNFEQQVAVENVCRQNYGGLPYLISGPPGTGKTKTIIETALQLINNVPNVHHILVCAPSEPAADTLAHRLMQYMGRDDMFRLNRPSRGFGEVSDELLAYCYIENDVFALPPVAQLLKYKIVVTSCTDASMLLYSHMTNSDLYAVESGLRSMIHPTESPTEARLHWGALLIDEAAQSKEPESLVPLSVVIPPSEGPELVFTPIVIMAGDEQQLTPRTTAPHTPLKRSLFARLFSRPVYANHPLARRLHFETMGQPPLAPPTLTREMLPILRPPFTNLVQNYRSHPAILAVPSKHFYYDTLEAQADIISASKLLHWPEWPRRPSFAKPFQQTWPILFHDNNSPDDLERDNGGWFNSVEAELACGYAKSLAESGLVSQSQICIMSPFKAQVRRIRKIARSAEFKLWDVNIGPTEAFQGLEYDVVVLCTTRSRMKYVEKDQQLGWGIIGPSQRNQLNVALTRAKAGLFMIGNRELLKQEDDCWKEMLEFCERNGCIHRPRDGNVDDGRSLNGDNAVVGERNRHETMMLSVERAAEQAVTYLN